MPAIFITSNLLGITALQFTFLIGSSATLRTPIHCAFGSHWVQELRLINVFRVDTNRLLIGAADQELSTNPTLVHPTGGELLTRHFQLKSVTRRPSFMNPMERGWNQEPGIRRCLDCNDLSCTGRDADRIYRRPAGVGWEASG